MHEIRIQSAQARYRYVAGDGLFAVLQFGEEKLSVALGPDCPPGQRVVSDLWSHTVFELQQLSEGLRFVATGGLPEYYEVPARKLLIGPSAAIRPAASFEIGHPGIGKSARTTLLYAWMRHERRHERNFVYLNGFNQYRSASARLEIEEVLELAEALFVEACRLEPILMQDRFE